MLLLMMTKGKFKSRRGNCYVTAEALYHLLGGKKAGWMPMCLHHENDTHWFLKHTSGLILDPTQSQFKNTPSYNNARGKGFLTKKPSKRAISLMDKLLWSIERKR